SVQVNFFRWLYKHRYTIGATAAAIILLISSIVIIPRSIAFNAKSPHTGSNSHYIPSSAFGDTDDLPNGSLMPPRLHLAAGTASISGTVKDASTGNPVANAQVGISPGAKGSTAQYTTTASDG